MIWLFGLPALAHSAVATPDSSACWDLSIQGHDGLLLGVPTKDIIQGINSDAPDVKMTCDSLETSIKQRVAFSMAVCHHWTHGRLDRMMESTRGECQEVVRRWEGHEADRRSFSSTILDFDLVHCIASLNDHAFQIYTEFLNHFDNLCYYYISKHWYDHVTSSVDSLLRSSQVVIEELHEAKGLQKAIKKESEGISHLTKSIYQDAHQLAQQVAQGEKNIVHLIDTVSKDVVHRSSDLSDSLEMLLTQTRRVHQWTNETYSLARKIQHYIYIPMAATIFWLLSRSQSMLIKFQLLSCFAASLFLSLYANVDETILRCCQVALFVIACLCWLRGWLFGKSDVQRLLQEFHTLQNDFRRLGEVHRRKGGGNMSPSVYANLSPDTRRRTSRAILHGY